MRYRKRPIEIEAEQFFPDRRPWPEGVERDCMGEYFIRTLKGVMAVTPGDWIICGVAGEVYPCKPMIFEQTYEKVSTT